VLAWPSRAAERRQRPVHEVEAQVVPVRGGAGPNQLLVAVAAVGREREDRRPEVADPLGGAVDEPDHHVRQPALGLDAAERRDAAGRTPRLEHHQQPG
jgi:hypothetical protein